MEYVKLHLNAVKELGIHRAAVLCWLLQNETETMFYQRQITRELKLTPPTVKVILDELQDKGYIVYWGCHEGMEHYSQAKIQEKAYKLING